MVKSKCGFFVVLVLSVGLVGVSGGQDVDFFVDGVFNFPASVVNVYNEAIVSVLDGAAASSFHAYDSSTILMQGGEIGSLQVFGHTILNQTRGEIGQAIGKESATINIFSGSIPKILAGLDASVVNVYDGVIPKILVWDNSTVHLKGGVIDVLETDLNGDTVFFYGTDFQLFPTGGHLGDGYVIGLWENGESFRVDFVSTRLVNPTASHINLIEIPEPATISLFALGSLIGIYRRKK